MAGLFLKVLLESNVISALAHALSIPLDGI
jgi:hypothetical protein